MSKTIRQSPTAVAASVNYDDYDRAFPQWNLWQNSFSPNFHLSPSTSADNISDISTGASTEAPAQFSYFVNYPPPQRVQQPEPSASSSSHKTGNEQQTRRERNGKYCKFCMTNKEMPEVYFSHSLHDSSGTLTCPILRNLVCPVCGATGDKAHTLSYCEVRKANAFGMQVPLFFKINKTCRLASGKLRNWKK